MLDSGGGGGSYGTNWHSLSVETMWQWVNRDLSPHYDQSTSWKKTSELCGLYQQRLQAFRDRLATSWNPETSKASEAFLTEIDKLIQAVKDVDEVSGRNYQAAVDIPNAIFEAKLKLEPIYQRWKQSETPEDADKHHSDAAGVMYTLSSDLSTARPGIGAPQPYVAPIPKRDTGGDYGDSSVPPPVIPPVVPTAPPSVPPPPIGPVTPMPVPRGPDLTGLTPPPPPTLPPTTPPGPGPHIPPPPHTGPGPGIPPIIKPPPGPRVPPLPGPPGVPGIPGRPPVTGPITGPVTGRGPTTGLIGGAPPSTGGRGVGGPRTNPVGGMIGSPATGRGGAGAAGRGPTAAGMVGRPGAPGAGGRGGGAAGRGAMGAMGVGGRPGQRDDGETDHLDPDTEWDVAEGVTPVLDTPENQGPIDPGPAIGLSR